MISREDIDAFNAHVRKYAHHDDFIYWTRQETLKRLKGALLRVVPHEGGAVCGPWFSYQILYDGKWYDLCRTDLKDDVRTSGGIPMAPHSSNLCQVDKEDCYYGARVTDDAIYLIDAISDG